MRSCKGFCSPFPDNIAKLSNGAAARDFFALIAAVRALKGCMTLIGRGGGRVGSTGGAGLDFRGELLLVGLLVGKWVSGDDVIGFSTLSSRDVESAVSANSEERLDSTDSS